MTAEPLPHDARPWGSWSVLDRGTGYQVKRLVVQPHHRLSYQTHAHRAERWVVASGTATCVLEGETRVLATGESLEIGVGQAHRLGNDHDVELVVVEVQLGAYLGEDDIVRLDDDYDRHPSR